MNLDCDLSITIIYHINIFNFFTQNKLFIPSSNIIFKHVFDIVIVEIQKRFKEKERKENLRFLIINSLKNKYNTIII